MDSMDAQVLRQAVQWLAEGRKPLLVTVVRTWGSSPRPEGSMLVLREDGRLIGSVSGGCIEDDLAAQAKAGGLRPARPITLRYGVSADEAHRFGLPCGGTLELVAEPLHEGSALLELLEAVNERRLVARSLDMSTGAVSITPAGAVAGVFFDGAKLVTVHGPRYRLLVIGAGQLSSYLCQTALGLDYQVTVCDPRVEYRDEWKLSGVTLVRTMPDDAVLEMQADDRSAVVALTHDPKLDDLALMEALKTPAFYVGALGSRQNNAARRKRLREFELSAEQIARLHGPAGIHIGSRTPPEIALSILAEMTAVRNGVLLPDALDIGKSKPRRTETHEKNTLGPVHTKRSLA